MGRFTPPDRLPTGLPAFGFAVVCFALAYGLTRGEIEVVVGDGSALVRAVVFLLLFALSVAVLMLGSDSAERALQQLQWRGKSLAGKLLYWLTTSLVALSAVVILGGALMLILWGVVNPTAPTPWEIALDFVIDVVGGAVAGVLATLTILVISRGLDRVIQGIDTWLRPCQLSACCRTTRRVLADRNGDRVVVAMGVGFRAKRAEARLRMPARTAAYVRPHPRVLHGTHASALAICLMAFGTWAASATIGNRTVSRLRQGRPPPWRTTYLQGIDADEIISTVHERPAPMIPATNGLLTLS